MKPTAMTLDELKELLEVELCEEVEIIEIPDDYMIVPVQEQKYLH